MRHRRLCAIGAPPELLQGVHGAAMDEVEHARLCLDVLRQRVGEFQDAAVRQLQARCEVVRAALLAPKILLAEEVAVVARVLEMRRMI